MGSLHLEELVEAFNQFHKENRLDRRAELKCYALTDQKMSIWVKVHNKDGEDPDWFLPTEFEKEVSNL